MYIPFFVFFWEFSARFEKLIFLIYILFTMEQKTLVSELKVLIDEVQRFNLNLNQIMNKIYSLNEKYSELIFEYGNHVLIIKNPNLPTQKIGRLEYTLKVIS